MGKLERGNTPTHYNKDCFFPSKMSMAEWLSQYWKSSLCLTWWLWKIWIHLKDAIVHFSWLTTHPQKESYFVQLLVSSHLQNSLKDCRRLTLEVACPRLPVRVLKRQNWAVSAPTVEKIGGAGGAKNAKHFKGVSHTHVSVNLSVNLLADWT